MPCNLLKCQCGSVVIPQRYVLCFMCFLGILIAYSMRLCLNIALTEIVVPKPPRNASHTNHTPAGEECPAGESPKVEIKGGAYNWTENQQGTILGSFFPGYVITHIPGGILSDTLGGRHVLSLSILLSAILSVITPLSIGYGDWWLLAALRFVMGAAQGVAFPAVTTMLAKWVPKKERGTLGALVMTGAQIGSITGNLITAVLMAVLGNWPVVFYFWGAVGVIWYVFFFILCFSEPAQHPFITDAEADMLAREIGKSDKLKIPWKKLIFYPPSLALMAGQIGHGAIFFLMVTDLPKYMKDVLKFNVKENGVLNSVPYLALWICGGISGVIADRLINSGTLSVGALRKIYTTIASVGPSTCCVIAGYMGCNRIAASAMFILGMFTMGPFYPGMRVNALDLTKNFAGILTAFVNGIGALAFAPVPNLIAVIAKDHTVEQWRLVFWIVFIVCGITNVIYVIWASGERADWDKAMDAEEEE